MAKTNTHNEWILRPPPGMRFINEFDGSVTLQFERGREAELVELILQGLNHMQMIDAFENKRREALNPKEEKGNGNSNSDENRNESTKIQST